MVRHAVDFQKGGSTIQAFDFGQGRTIHVRLVTGPDVKPSRETYTGTERTRERFLELVRQGETAALASGSKPVSAKQRLLTVVREMAEQHGWRVAPHVQRSALTHQREWLENSSPLSELPSHRVNLYQGSPPSISSRCPFI